MSLPVYRGLSGPVMCVPTVGNLITQRERIDASNETTNAGPVAKKIALISWQAYPRGLKATQRCQQCHRDFFGETCFQDTSRTVDHTGKPDHKSLKARCAFVAVAVRD